MCFLSTIVGWLKTVQLVTSKNKITHIADIKRFLDE